MADCRVLSTGQMKLLGLGRYFWSFWNWGKVWPLERRSMVSPWAADICIGNFPPLSSAYIINPSPVCFTWLIHATRLDLVLMLLVGINIAIRMTIIKITSKTSRRVMPLRLALGARIFTAKRNVALLQDSSKRDLLGGVLGGDLAGNVDWNIGRWLGQSGGGPPHSRTLREIRAADE